MYGSVTDWIDYAAERGLVVEDNAASAQALQRASDYIRTRYVLRLAPAYDDQSPQTIEATYIAAAYELETPGFWSKTFTPTEAKVLTKVGELSWTPLSSSEFSGIDAALPTSPAIESLFLGARQFSGGPFVV